MVGEPDNDTVAAIAVPLRYRWLKRISVGVVVLMMLAVGLRLAWGWYADRALQAEIDRIRAAGEPIFPEDFDSPDVPHDQNAVVLLEEAIAVMEAVKIDLPAGTDSVGDRLYELTQTTDLARANRIEVRNIVREYQQVFELVRRARARPAVGWGFKFRSPVFLDPGPDLSSHRNMAKLTFGAAVSGHIEGDDAHVTDLLRDMIFMSNAMDEQPFLMGHLVSKAQLSLVAHVIERIAPNLAVSGKPRGLDPPSKSASPEQVRDLMTDLLASSFRRDTLVRAMQSERMLQLDAVKQCLTGRMGLTSLATGTTTPPLPPDLVAIQNVIWGPILKLDGLHMMRRASTIVAASAEDDWSACDARLTQLPDAPTGVRMHVRFLSTIITPSYAHAVLLHFRMTAEARMAALALAIRLYELDHGRRPETLDALVPTYIPAVPTDLFAADDRPIGYLPAAEPPRLYSIGPNGQDDAGAIGFRAGGGIDQDAQDIPFFLDGDRHRWDGSTTTSQPASDQADGHDGEVSNEQGDANKNHTAESQP